MLPQDVYDCKSCGASRSKPKRNTNYDEQTLQKWKAMLNHARMTCLFADELNKYSGQSDRSSLLCRVWDFLNRDITPRVEHPFDCLESIFWPPARGHDDLRGAAWGPKMPSVWGSSSGAVELQARFYVGAYPGMPQMYVGFS